MNKSYILAFLGVLALGFAFSELSKNVLRDRENARLWADERLKAYEICVNLAAPDTSTNLGGTGYYDAMKLAFRGCKNLSEEF
jgi:hypothetical protein